MMRSLNRHADAPKEHRAPALRGRLSVKRFERALRSRKRARFSDGAGLLLEVRGEKRAAWLFRFERRGRERWLGLGSAFVVSIEEARRRADAVRVQLANGIDPFAARDRARAAPPLPPRGLTFQKAAEDFIIDADNWKNDKHRKQWKSTLARYAYPRIGAMDVGAIDTDDILDVLRPIWKAKPETGNRLRGRIEKILDRARVIGKRNGDNPARWRGHLDKVFKPKSELKPVRHHPALPVEDVSAFFQELEVKEGVSPVALRFLLLTAGRTSEIVKARWPEVDLDARVWTIPGARMKGGREHRVPLTDAAVALLKSLPREDGSDFIFVGGKEGSHLSNMALLELMRGMRKGFVVHGLRSSFKSWASERTSYPNELSEMALAHVIKDKVERAYRRGDLLDRRRPMMDDWAKFLMTKASEAGTVIPIRKRVRK
jgi:integrase